MTCAWTHEHSRNVDNFREPARHGGLQASYGSIAQHAINTGLLPSLGGGSDRTPGIVSGIRGSCPAAN